MGGQTWGLLPGTLKRPPRTFSGQLSPAAQELRARGPPGLQGPDLGGPSSLPPLDWESQGPDSTPRVGRAGRLARRKCRRGFGVQQAPVRGGAAAWPPCRSQGLADVTFVPTEERKAQPRGSPRSLKPGPCRAVPSPPSPCTQAPAAAPAPHPPAPEPAEEPQHRRPPAPLPTSPGP